MRITPRQRAVAILFLAVIALLAGCATVRPPARIQDAIHTVNRYMPEYVAEANAALEEAEHPDKERLIGIGERLERAIQALDAWANPEGEKGKDGD